MQRTIDLLDDLAQRLDTYLQEHPEETFYSLVRQVLETKLMPKDTSKLLALAGIITEIAYSSTDNLNQ